MVTIVTVRGPRITQTVHMIQEGLFLRVAVQRRGSNWGLSSTVTRILTEVFDSFARPIGSRFSFVRSVIVNPATLTGIDAVH